MPEFNYKDERIAKLFKRGLTPEQIARKIGMPGNIERVLQALQRKGLIS